MPPEISCGRVNTDVVSSTRSRKARLRGRTPATSCAEHPRMAIARALQAAERLWECMIEVAKG